MKNSFFKALWNYLSDWKNLLTHAIIGFGILAAMLWLPVNGYIRLGIFVAVVIINIFRMKKEKKSKITISENSVNEA